MNRMGCELLLCVGVFAALGVYECLRVAYHRQIEGNRRSGLSTPKAAVTPFWRAVTRLLGMVSGMYLYEKLYVRYHWRIRASRRHWLKRQSTDFRVGLRSDRRDGSMERNNFAVASRMVSGAGADSRVAQKDRNNG